MTTFTVPTPTRPTTVLEDDFYETLDDSIVLDVDSLSEETLAYDALVCAFTVSGAPRCAYLDPAVTIATERAMFPSIVNKWCQLACWSSLVQLSFTTGTLSAELYKSTGDGTTYSSTTPGTFTGGSIGTDTSARETATACSVSYFLTTNPTLKYTLPCSASILRSSGCGPYGIYPCYDQTRWNINIASITASGSYNVTTTFTVVTGSQVQKGSFIYTIPVKTTAAATQEAENESTFTGGVWNTPIGGTTTTTPTTTTTTTTPTFPGKYYITSK